MEEKPSTVPQDARYMNQNATKWCFATFVDYQKCIRLLPDNTCCDELKKIFTAVCPHGWVTRWEQQIVKGTFPVDLPPKECVPKSYLLYN